MNRKNSAKLNIIRIVRYLIFPVLPVSVLFYCLFFYNKEPDGKIYKEYFSKLEDVRIKKKEKIIDYFESIKAKAFDIKNDSYLLNIFNVLQNSKSKISAVLEYEIDKYYVTNYGNFYDILFVDSSGYVFFSIKRENDYKTNLFGGDLSNTKLVKNLKGEKLNQFVDYEYYSPSNEPAAFFTTPVYKSKKLTGWFILQCSINNLNAILSDKNSLGRTGEVYLVNKEKLMLSESRFIEDNTILKLKIDTEAVKESIKMVKGQKILKDYRSVCVLSSFEKFDYFGNTWIIIAEIDEDEVVTEYYKKYNSYFNKKIFSSRSNEPESTKSIKFSVFERGYRVDMNEYAKCRPDSSLKTYGVSLCTAVAIYYPGRFGYLAHISPTDEIYDPDVFNFPFFSAQKTNILSTLIEKIKYYEIYPYELKNLKFVIIAPHNKSFSSIMEELINLGIDISNIKFAYDPEAISANVLLDMGKDNCIIEWNKNRGSYFISVKEIKDSESIVKSVSGGQSAGNCN